MQTDSTTKGARLTGEDFKVRRAQVAAILAAVLAGGKPEVHAGSSALCTHFKLRRGNVGADRAEAQVYSHEAGTAIRFWVYGPDFSARVRDLLILPTPDKGAEVWLGIDGKLFPHEGKYMVAALQITANVLAGR